MSANQWSEKAGIQCSQEYPIFHFLFQLHDILNSPLNKATRGTCDLHSHTSRSRPERKKYLDRKFWELERVAYLAMETDVDRGNVRWSIRETSTTTGEFDHRMCGSRVSSWTGNVSGMEEP